MDAKYLTSTRQHKLSARTSTSVTEHHIPTCTLQQVMGRTEKKAKWHHSKHSLASTTLQFVMVGFLPIEIRTQNKLDYQEDDNKADWTQENPSKSYLFLPPCKCIGYSSALYFRHSLREYDNHFLGGGARGIGIHPHTLCFVSHCPLQLKIQQFPPPPQGEACLSPLPSYLN